MYATRKGQGHKRPRQPHQTRHSTGVQTIETIRVTCHSHSSSPILSLRILTTAMLAKDKGWIIRGSAHAWCMLCINVCSKLCMDAAWMALE